MIKLGRSRLPNVCVEKGWAMVCLDRDEDVSEGITDVQ